MKRFGFVLAAGLMMCGPAWAQGFSADMVSRAEGREMRGKVAVTEQKMRFEMGESVVITRMDQGASWVLMPAEKMAMKQPVDFKTASQFSKNIQGETSRKDLGDESIGGKPAHKFQVTYEALGQSETVTQWIGKEGFPLKVASVDGKWSIEYQNLKAGPQPDSLFEVPAGYKVMDMEALKKGIPSMRGLMDGSSQ